jgi:hypothetical protein
MDYIGPRLRTVSRPSVADSGVNLSMSDMAIYRHLTSGGQVQSLRENGMSYNVAVCTAPVPEDDEAAWAKLDDLSRQKIRSRSIQELA